MSPLQDVLASYRHAAASEREKGTYFEDLIRTYLRNEASYRDLYSEVWTYGEWAKSQGLDARDTGIDLVACTQGTNELHAIQCKNYAPDYRIQKKDIDSFFTASGKQAFKHRIIVATTNHWSEHAEEALRDQQTPVSKIDLHDLENSQIDWSRYRPAAQPSLKAQKSLRPHQRTAHEAVLAGLAQADRGKLIMACGTGKTFTSLKIAETLAGRGGRVLFLVPSLALLSQALTEWSQESETPLHNFAVCSDSDVGKKKSKADSDDDRVQTLVHELRYPATTSAARLAEEIGKRHDGEQVDVVQSVGRVMRNAPGKKRGYIVLPVVIPAGVEPHEALNDNKTYKVVWQVLQALRSHDDRFDAMVNKLDLIGKNTSKMEIIAVTDKIAKKPTKATPEQKTRHAAKTGHSIGEPAPKPYVPEQTALQFEIGEIERAIYAKLVQKVGTFARYGGPATALAQAASSD